MGQVTATSSTTIDAAPARVLAAIADYATVRPRILTDRYRDYRVESGGVGAGTVVHWILQATESRQRDVTADVTTTDSTVVETDRNSTLVTTWTVTPRGAGSEVTVSTTWQGAGGIGGFFERTFAPGGLRKIQQGVLDNLAREVTAQR